MLPRSPAIALWRRRAPKNVAQPEPCSQAASLGHDEERDIGRRDAGESIGEGTRDRDRRVEVSTAHRAYEINRKGDSQGPTDIDDQPAGIL